MILSFKKQFAEPILNGSKIHTIRHDSKNRWKEGNKIHFATDVRTKNQVQFHESTCVSIQEVVIYYAPLSRFPVVIIDGRKLNSCECSAFASLDGFESFAKFTEWFSEDFEGKIIHWTNKKY